jgi:hypothetical protein
MAEIRYFRAREEHENGSWREVLIRVQKGANATEVAQSYLYSYDDPQWKMVQLEDITLTFERVGAPVIEMGENIF